MTATAPPPGNAPAAFQAAARAWAKSTFGAPLFFDQVITGVKEKEEVLTRIATQIVRREVLQERVPAPPGYQPQGQPIDPKSIDPWQIAPEQLRAATETL